MKLNSVIFTLGWKNMFVWTRWSRKQSDRKARFRYCTATDYIKSFLQFYLVVNMSNVMCVIKGDLFWLSKDKLTDLGKD